jgi:7-cyano-7-deazaguanine synthase
MNKIEPNSALVIFSGGQDSTICLGWALKVFEKVEAITFDYGQKHAIEIQAASEVIAFFEKQYDRKISHEIVRLGEGTFQGTSPLTDSRQELETYQNHAEMEEVIGNRVEKTFVPMRNAAFLVYAANRAVVKGCGAIVTGVCQADNANYPDCTSSFIESMQETINKALGFDIHTDQSISIDTPLILKSKAQSILWACSIPHAFDALAWSHTAYDGTYPPNGKDHASILRAHGFEEAGLADPLVIRAWRQGLMDLPNTPNYEAFRHAT